jgi:type VI secretion system protein ImpJ
VVDENSGGAELRIPRLVPRLHLLAADDPPPKFVTLPIAEVTHADETFALTPWVPPGLEIARHSPLGRICSEIATRLREKAVFLAERVHSPSAAARRAWLLETQAAIHGVVAGLPHLEALVASGAAHPFPLYLALCQIVGQVAGVGSALVPPVLEPYEHDDLLATFEQARRAIFQVLDEGILETYAAYPFRAEDGAFRIDLDPAWKGRRLVIGVRTRDGVDEREVRAWIDAALIGSASRIPSLRERRIVGAPRRPIDDDRDLVAGRNRHLFDLEADPDFVALDEPLELRNLDDPAGALRPLEVLLYVRKDDGDGA